MRNILLVLFSMAVAQSATAKKKTFVYCSEASPKIFNPQLGTDLSLIHI